MRYCRGSNGAEFQLSLDQMWLLIAEGKGAKQSQPQRHKVAMIRKGFVGAYSNMQSLSIDQPISATITTLSLQSQFSPRFVYCLIIGRQSMSNSEKFSIEIEYGDNKELSKDNRIRDDDGKVKVFTSMVDPLNMLAKDGWEFVQVILSLRIRFSSGHDKG